MCSAVYLRLLFVQDSERENHTHTLFFFFHNGVFASETNGHIFFFFCMQCFIRDKFHPLFLLGGGEAPFTEHLSCDHKLRKKQTLAKIEGVPVVGEQGICPYAIIHRTEFTTLSFV